MADVKLDHIKKIYQSGVVAVEDTTIEIKDGEFIVLVGPSGCGKSTTLRMIAGLEDITEGHLYIDGKDVTHVPPKDRDIAMVFQNYALYGNMTVYDIDRAPIVIRRNDGSVTEYEVGQIQTNANQTKSGIIDSFIDCLENDTEPSISGADVLAAMKAVFASIKSSEEGVRVTIDR